MKHLIKKKYLNLSNFNYISTLFLQMFQNYKKIKQSTSRLKGLKCFSICEISGHRDLYINILRDPS